jgi:hypothetical protein
MAEVFSRTDHFRLVDHNDAANAVGLAIIFDSPKAALAFKEKHQLSLLIESGRHVYTNWEPLLEQRAFHPKMNPFNWTRRKIEYAKDMCSKTLEILSRSISLPVPYEMDGKELRAFAEKLIS